MDIDVDIQEVNTTLHVSYEFSSLHGELGGMPRSDPVCFAFRVLVLPSFSLGVAGTASRAFVRGLALPDLGLP